MRGMPFNLQGGKEGVEGEGRILCWSNNNSKITVDNKKKEGGVEPRSVLDHRRSPSPPTSTSTLSSSLGGGGGSTDTAGVAALSDNKPPPHKWPPPTQDTITSSAAAAAAAAGEGRSSEIGGGGREEWASEFQPITPGLDKCGLVGMEDFETMLSETAAAAAATSPSQEQSFLTWIMGDVDDSSAFALNKQHNQLLLSAPHSVEFETGGGAGAGAGGFGLVDPAFGFEHLAPSVGPLLASSSSSSSGLGFPFMAQSSGLKFPYLGNNPNAAVFSQPPPAAGNSLPLSLPPVMYYQEPMEEKPQIYSPASLLLNQQQPQNPAFFLPLSPYLQPDHHHHHHQQPSQPKRHHHPMMSEREPTCQISPKVGPFSDSGQELFLRRQHQPGIGSFNVNPQNNSLPQRAAMRPKMAGDDVATHHHHQQQQQALLDQLFKAAEQVEAGNSVNARGILARLNHQLSPIGKPLIRSSFYFKEALHSILHNPPPSPSSPPPPPPMALATPLEVVHKLSAYKAFSEVSPILQFTNFTCIQALLEELNVSDSRIHIIDFDIGVGGQWSSFMQELAQRRCSTPSLKITAIVSTSSFHPLELGLTRENLSHFARDLNIPFEFNILGLDSFNPAGLLNMSDEVVAVNLPVGLAYPSIPTLLRLVKQLSPRIVVSVDHGCNRSELSFSHHFLHAFQSSTVLLESIDAAGTNLEVSQKIEQFLIQPRIESSILGRHRAAEKMLPWRSLFATAGFSPVPFSNFTETQAECLLKRIQVRGFHVEKQQASLLLCWQRGELVSVSAWRC